MIGTEPDGSASSRIGWRGFLVALAVYTLALSAATYPRVRDLGTKLPSVTDPVTELSIMRWHRDCWLAGRPAAWRPDVQAPVGAAMGQLPPLRLHSLLYVPLSAALRDDTLCYNVLWLLGFLGTGLGTMLLAWEVVGDRPAAGLAGLLAMLSGPMMMHGLGHLELVTVGAFPLFLIAWMRFVDRPGVARLLASAALYVLVVTSASYFLLLTVWPAGWYVFVAAVGARRGGRLRHWLRTRAGWLVGFAVLVAAAFPAIFSDQLWAAAHGYTVTRGWSEFAHFGAPAWSYAVPTRAHLLGSLFGWSRSYEEPLFARVECVSYLGVVTLALAGFAAAARVGFRRSGYWWSALVLMAVLSLGATISVAGVPVLMPAGWLYRTLIAFRLIRVPARFNLLVAVFAAVAAAAGLKGLMERYGPGSRLARGVLVGCLGALAVVDLAVVPFPTAALPAMPGLYTEVTRREPRGLILEAPVFPSEASAQTSGLASYYQFRHGGRTTAGYTAHANLEFNERVVTGSPFEASLLSRPGSLEAGGAVDFGVVRGARFLDYAWLYLHTLDVGHVVLHRGAMIAPGNLARLESWLAPAKVLDDGLRAVYDPRRLPPPSRPVAVRTTGWRRALPRGGRTFQCVSESGRLVVFNPAGGNTPVLRLEARAYQRARRVRLLRGETVLARWEVGAETFGQFPTPPLSLPTGATELILRSDGEDRPRGEIDAPAEGDDRPFSLLVAGLTLEPAPARAP